jgi:hypothetical protein
MALLPRTAALFHREKGIAGRRVEGSRARARLVSRGLQALTSLRGTGREDWPVSTCIPRVMNTGRNANWIQFLITSPSQSRIGPSAPASRTHMRDESWPAGPR